ncbi:uncharacterized protein TNCV_2560701 [Trichonephila clavipes]|uniref:Swi5-dependent recombination DNA repair protein 1 homolog n=1 Tax=Trichonephila clavipes TaxID=2585209 RepID=A0A8X6USN8_TRICX|nr:uncharacterized protein TNCV_2560701 [Trichonephila clavipes]
MGVVFGHEDYPDHYLIKTELKMKQGPPLKMSSSLKEKLKRSSRVHSSPLSKCVSPVIFTPKIQIRNVDCPNSPKRESPPLAIKLTENIYSYTKEDIEECEDKSKLQEMYFNLQKQTDINEEKLRKLKLVEKHHNKNKPDDLVLVIQRWLTTAQDALKKLYEILPEPKPPNMQSLINFLQIDSKLLKYNADRDIFL